MKKINEYEQEPVNGLPIAFRRFDSSDPKTRELFPEHYYKEKTWSSYIKAIRIRRGFFQGELNLKPLFLHAGDIIFVNPQDLSEICSLSDDWSLDTLEFTPLVLSFAHSDHFSHMVLNPLAKGVLRLPELLDEKTECTILLHQLFDQMADADEQQSDVSMFRVRLRLLEMLCILSEAGLLVSKDSRGKTPDTQKVERYRKVTSYIDKYYDRPLTLQDLANLVPCNSQYLCRFFKDISGTSPIQYLIKVRIEKACELLEKTEHSVLDIGLEVGFDNGSYFVRKFKELKGVTPKAYRKQLSETVQTSDQVF